MHCKTVRWFQDAASVTEVKFIPDDAVNCSAIESKTSTDKPHVTEETAASSSW